MTFYATLVVAVSMLLLLAVTLLRGWQGGRWNSVVVDTTSLVAVAAFLNWLFGFPVPLPETSAKGIGGDAILVFALFVSMILGMIAQALYYHYSQPRAARLRKRFDWGVFLSPLFASPIVFIPLMVALQNADIDLKALTVPRMMIFFVAFQNGFFWKEHFDRKRHDAEAGKP